MMRTLRRLEKTNVVWRVDSKMYIVLLYFSASALCTVTDVVKVLTWRFRHCDERCRHQRWREYWDVVAHFHQAGVV